MTRNFRRRIRLGLESLENRRLLAVAAFQAELYSDDGGVPGDLLADNTVTAGETFFLRVTAQEFDRFRNGLRSAAIDVDWDAGLLSAVESDFQLDSVITSDLPAFRGGSLDNMAGSIDELSGTALLSSGAGRAIGNNGPDTFAMIRMQAGTEPGEGSIALSESESKTITVPTTILRGQQLRFDTETIVIVPASASSNSADRSPEPEPAVVNIAESNDLAEPIGKQKSQANGQAVISSEVEHLNAANAIASVSFPQADQHAATVDEALSFDLNQDGIFDLADFGLLNLSAQPATEVAEESEVDVSTVEADESGSNATATNETAFDFHSVCTAAPPRHDVAAMETWLDALAYAWIANAEARERRNSVLF